MLSLVWTVRMGVRVDVLVFMTFLFFNWLRVFDYINRLITYVKMNCGLRHLYRAYLSEILIGYSSGLYHCVGVVKQCIEVFHVLQVLYFGIDFLRAFMRMVLAAVGVLRVITPKGS